MSVAVCGRSVTTIPCFWVPVLMILFVLSIWTRLAVADPVESKISKGPVQATVHLEPSDPLMGDSVTLTLQVTAEKDVELLMPGFGQMLERFAILDFVSNEQVDKKGRTVAVQRYQLQPSRSGRQSIPPIMIEFVDRRDGVARAPKGLDAYELLTERVPFEVRSVLPDDVKADLSPPLGVLSLQQVSTGSRWLWLFGAVALIVVVSIAIWRTMWTSHRKARRRSAYELASGRLARLLDRPRDKPHQVRAFFVELSAIVRQYLEDRFELRAPELTTEEFLALMSRSPDLLHEHQALLRQFLRQADLVKFANLVPADDDIDQSVTAARCFLDETRQDVTGADAPVTGVIAAGVETA